MLYDSNRKIQKLYRSPLILQVEEICIIGVKHTIKKKVKFLHLFLCSHSNTPVFLSIYLKYNCSHFTYWETEAQRGTKLPKTTK